MLSGVNPVLETVPRVPAGLQDVDHLSDVRGPDGFEELDRRLAVLCRQQGPLRAVVARIAWRLVSLRAWERIGYARLSDYAVERFGLSGRSLQSLARVGQAFLGRPQLEHALVSGRLNWTKVRLLAGLPLGEDIQRWIARAERLSADRLAKRVRGVDRYSVDASGAEASRGGGLLELRCNPQVRWKWGTARGVASRAAGRQLQVVEAAELIAAEVLSALSAVEPDETSDDDARPEGEEAGAPESNVSEHDAERHRRAGARCVASRAASHTLPVRPTLSAREPVQLDSELQELLEDLKNADAFEANARLRTALAREQSLEARIAPLLILAWQPGVHRTLGFTTRQAWVRERLGMDATRARSLVRLERACAESPPLARAWRAGVLSWVKAGALVPLVSADPLGRFIEDWVRWAGRITVRRLREDTERALLQADVDPQAFRRDGGLPPEARRRPSRDEASAGTRTDREIRAIHRDPQRESHHTGQSDRDGGDSAGRDYRVFGAQTETLDGEEGISRSPEGLAARAHAGLSGRPRPDERCWVRLVGSREVVRLFRAALCTVRRRIEVETGRLPTAGEALDAMLDHAFAAWGVDAKVPARHRVFARDGWRCAAPGCSSMQNLHDHHVRFRSAGGSNAPENRVTLCAFHHLRGVHAGRIRCVGRAPDGLTWQLGIRPGAAPLLSYRSGDIRIRVAEAFRPAQRPVAGHCPAPAG